MGYPVASDVRVSEGSISARKLPLHQRISEQLKSHLAFLLDVQIRLLNYRSTKFSIYLDRRIDLYINRD